MTKMMWALSVQKSESANDISKYHVSFTDDWPACADADYTAISSDMIGCEFCELRERFANMNTVNVCNSTTSAALIPHFTRQ